MIGVLLGNIYIGLGRPEKVTWIWVRRLWGYRGMRNCRVLSGQETVEVYEVRRAGWEGNRGTLDVRGLGFWLIITGCRDSYWTNFGTVVLSLTMMRVQHFWKACASI